MDLPLRHRIISACLLAAIMAFSLATTTPLASFSLNMKSKQSQTSKLSTETTSTTSQQEENSSTAALVHQSQTGTSELSVPPTSKKSPDLTSSSSSSKFPSGVTVPGSLDTLTTTQRITTATEEEEREYLPVNHTSSSSGARIDVFKNHFGHVGALMYISVTTLISSLLVLGYHHCHTLTKYLPESCFLLCIGIIAGFVIRFTNLDEVMPDTFNPDTFFLVLLPPIILGASYSLNNRIFYDNLGVVLLFAVLGTAAACFLIAPFLYGLSQTSALILPPNNLFKQIFVFSAFVVAVDPVAVLAVFSELGVNKPLHIVVFGESLLNDGVSVVLYRVMININKMSEITEGHIGMAFLKFVVCVVASCFIGCCGGVIATLVCKYSYSRHIMEPVILVSTAYISYILAESLDLSGIISMIVCGLVQAQYAFHNINSKSRTNTKFIIKVISTSAELVIFIFLGISLVRTRHQWNAGFIIWSLVACSISRVLVTFLFSFFVNKFHGERMKIFSFEEQIIMAYSGLRGGVAFSLSLQLNEKDVPLRNTFVTTVLIIILFNVVIQGITIRPLVGFLKVKLEAKSKKNLMTTINNQLADEILQLMEKIIGRNSGHNIWRKRVENFELNHIQCYLLKSPHPSGLKIESVHEKVAMRAMHDFLVSLHSPIPSINVDTQQQMLLTRNSILNMTDHMYLNESSASTRFPSMQVFNPNKFSNLLHNRKRQSRDYQQDYSADNAAFDEGAETEINDADTDVDADADADIDRRNYLQAHSANQRKLSHTSETTESTNQRKLSHTSETTESTNQEETNKAISATQF